MGAGGSINVAVPFVCHACGIRFIRIQMQAHGIPECPQCSSAEFVEDVTMSVALPLMSLTSELSRQGQALTTTSIMLRLLEQQLRQELMEAAQISEAQRRSAAEAASERHPVPLCEIEAFPRANFEEFEKDGAGSCSREGDVCCICDENYVTSADAVRLPVCSHVFHRECITKWLRIKNTCPICRHQLPAVPSLDSLLSSPIESLHQQCKRWSLDINDGDCKQHVASVLHQHLAQKTPSEIKEEEDRMAEAAQSSGSSPPTATEPTFTEVDQTETTLADTGTSSPAQAAHGMPSPIGGATGDESSQMQPSV